MFIYLFQYSKANPGSDWVQSQLFISSENGKKTQVFANKHLVIVTTKPLLEYSTWEKNGKNLKSFFRFQFSSWLELGRKN